jgi:hypothetical protein
MADNVNLILGIPQMGLAQDHPQASERYHRVGGNQGKGSLNPLRFSVKRIAEKSYGCPEKLPNVSNRKPVTDGQF